MELTALRNKFSLHGMAIGRRELERHPQEGVRVLVVGKLVQRNFEVEGNKRSVVEIQVTHVGPDLQFQSAEVEKQTSSEEKQSA